MAQGSTVHFGHFHTNAHVFSMVSDGMQEEEKGLLLRGPDPPQSNFSPIFTGETLNPVCESGLTLQAIPLLYAKTDFKSQSNAVHVYLHC